MGLLDRVTDTLGRPPIQPVQCGDCGARFDADPGTCPSCGGELEYDDIPAALRWGEMW
jgi:predicted Zn-ribbon and HTH transcriptional regulator